MCNDYFIALIGLSIRSQTQSPAEQYVGRLCIIWTKSNQLSIQFVTGSIGDLFEKGSSKRIKIKSNNLKLKMKS